uniref:Uncharacterized protein n=1 Tax=Arundo donax TaxID=35708 RepID=A0A0A9FUW6_ARUDO
MCQPQSHLPRARKKDSSRLTHAGWYTFGQPLRSQTTRLPPSKQMKHTTSSSFRFAGFAGAGTAAAPSLFFGGLPLFLFTGNNAPAAAGCCWSWGWGWGWAAAPMIDPRKCWSSKPSEWRRGDASFFGWSCGGGGRWGLGDGSFRSDGGAGGGGPARSGREYGGGGGSRSSGGHSASPGESTSAPGPVPPSMDQAPGLNQKP